VHSRKIKNLVRNTAEVSCELCGSELEALLLESRLIKQHKPKYNTLQKKARNRPFVKIDFSEDFPGILVVFEIQLDGARYFGPFRNSAAAQETVETIHKLFPLRACDGRIKPHPDTRPCLNYHIERCLAPCAAKVSKEEYNDILNNVIQLICGEHTKLLDELVKLRNKASAELRFEQASKIHDRISRINQVIQRHKFQVNAVDNNNVVVVCPSSDSNAVELLFIRGGRLRSQKRVIIAPEAKLIRKIQPQVMKIFSECDEPREITPLDVDAMNIISQWLYANRNNQRIILFPNHQNWQNATEVFIRKIIEVIHNQHFTL
jgi:excinuclease ABC subunit C